MEMGSGGFGERGREERGKEETEQGGREANGGRREEIRNTEEEGRKQEGQGIFDGRGDGGTIRRWEEKREGCGGRRGVEGIVGKGTGGWA